MNALDQIDPGRDWHDGECHAPDIGCFVLSNSHEKLGIGKLVARDGNKMVIEFFDSPIAASRHQIQDDVANVVKIQLTPQTRVYFFDERCAYWRSGRVCDHIDNKCYISLPNQAQIILDDSQVYTRWNHPIEDPCEHLAARVCETPFFHSVRAELLASFVRQRAVALGMTGFLSAPIALERHQLEVVRRVLHDPVQRYLLADEVGLGKTIEAGVIIRQFVLDHLQTHRVLVIAPETLISQWKSELIDRCQLAEHFGHNVMVVALERLAQIPRTELVAGMVVVDEAHQAVRGWEQPRHTELGNRFELLREITSPNVASRLLLLSATPVRRNEDGFLALLHLLDPAVYRLSDKDAFREKVAKRQELADLFYAFTENQQSFFLGEMVEQLSGMFPRDGRMLELLTNLSPWLHHSVSEDSVDRRDAIRALRTHLSETYRLHRRLLRNRRSREVEGLLPGRTGLIQFAFRDLLAHSVEQGLERWRAAAALSVWNRETSEEAMALSRIFTVLLEAASCDLHALKWCVAERICPGQPAAPIFGRLVEQSRARILSSQPRFEGENELLMGIYRAVRLGNNLNQSRIQQIAVVANQQLSKGFRVVVFASSPALADELYTFLENACQVAVYRHELADDQWHCFHDVAAQSILVADWSAEEGLNLQGGKTCMIHSDLPLSPNSIEQRMGRLDRFGVGDPVVSLAPVPEECPYQQAWVACLSDAYGVFSNSIAALQYVVEDEMRRLSIALLTDGEPALRASSLRLSGDRGVLRSELKSIRAQDELDSIGVAAGDGSDDLSSKIEAFEQGFNRFQCQVELWVCSRLQFNRIGEDGPNDNVVRYQPSLGAHRPTLMSTRDFQQWFSSSFDRNAQHCNYNRPQTWPLTFSRETARSRKVGLGRIGNPMIDCLHRYLRWDDRGTCFAFWRVSHLVDAAKIRLFLRFDFVIEFGLRAVSELASSHPELSEAALRRRGDMAFPPLSRSLWLSEDFEEADEEFLDELNRPYNNENTDTDTNINQARWERVQARFDLDNWPHHCRVARDAAVDLVARQVGLAQLTSELTSCLELETKMVEEQFRSRIQALCQSEREADLAKQEWDMERKIRQALLAGIHEHRIQLDAAGAVFLAGSPLSP